MDPSEKSASNGRRERHTSESGYGVSRWFILGLVGAFFGIGIFGYFFIIKNFQQAEIWHGGQDYELTIRSSDVRPIHSFRSQGKAVADSSGTQLEPPGAVANERVLVFADADALSQAEQLLRQAGVRVIGRIGPLNALRVYAPGGISQFFPEWKDAEEFNMGVRLPTPPAIYEDLRTGYRSFEGKWLESLGLSVTSLAGERGSGVMIAVLDSGFYPHGDMDLSRIQWLDLIDGSSDWSDPLGHGTAVAGLIGSHSPLAPGLSLDSDLMVVRVLDENGHGNSFSVAEGIVAAVAAGANIINLSLGSSGHSPLLFSAVEYARANGVVIVAAAGNDGAGKVSFPAAYAEVIGVTSVDADRYRAGFANYGDGIDIAAPGVGLYGLSNDDGYIYFDGTSASSSIVSASLAWIMGQNSELSAAEAVDVLKTYADDTGPPGRDVLMGNGIVNLGRIERSGGAEFFDLALADIFPDVRYAQSGSLPVLVTIENRGNTSASGAKLEVNVSGHNYSFYFGRMEPNTVMHAEIPSSLQFTRSDDGLQVYARVLPVDREYDDNPDNDGFGIMFRAAPQK